MREAAWSEPASCGARMRSSWPMLKICATRTSISTGTGHVCADDAGRTRAAGDLLDRPVRAVETYVDGGRNRTGQTVGRTTASQRDPGGFGLNTSWTRSVTLLRSSKWEARRKSRCMPSPISIRTQISSRVDGRTRGAADGGSPPTAGRGLDHCAHSRTSYPRNQRPCGVPAPGPVVAPPEAGDRAYAQFQGRHPRPLGCLVRGSPSHPP